MGSRIACFVALGIASCSTPPSVTPRAPTAATSVAEPATAPPVADPSLVKRSAFFGNPERAGASIRPDGKQLAFLAPSEGVLNVWVAELDAIAEAKPVTDDRSRGIGGYAWAHDNRHILYLQDEGGDENWRIVAVDVQSLERKPLTPPEGVMARIEGLSHRRPHEVLVALNDRDPKAFDLHSIDLRSGRRTLVLKNELGFVGMWTDDDLRPRVGKKLTPEGNFAFFFAVGDRWEKAFEVGPDDSAQPRGFDAAGDTLYLIDPGEGDKAALLAMDMATKKTEVLHASDQADVGQLLRHPTKRTPQAASVTYLEQRWSVLDESLEPDFAALRNIGDGEVRVSSRSLDDRHWIVTLVDDDGPATVHHYDRKTKKATRLFSTRPSLEAVSLAPMHPVVIESRDGKDLVSYLTLPPASDPDGDGRPVAPVPMVLYVHGGPWERDTWGYHPVHQLFASRGYAVLSVNFRGSKGFGKSFLNAGNREWGRKMHDDLVDAVRWAEGERIASKTAIMGMSYGGYATLAGLTVTPEVFACGVDVVGPSNLISFIESFPPYWRPLYPLVKARIGDWQTEEGRRFLAARSPLNHIAKIKRPLLIAQGANDPRVKKQESDQIVEALDRKGIDVTYLLYPDEGHGFGRPENSTSFFAVAEIFLAQCLGGRYQPIGADFEGSSLQVPVGAEHVHGLADALKK